MAIVIFAFFIILNGHVTWEIALIGIAVTALCLFFMCRFCGWSLRREIALYRVAPLAAGYAFTVLWEIVKANFAMTRLVWHGTPSPAVRVVRTGLKTRFARMVLANSITLTPGTVTLSCRENELVVHCLTHEMGEGLENSVFERKLSGIEALLNG